MIVWQASSFGYWGSVDKVGQMVLIHDVLPWVLRWRFLADCKQKRWDPSS